MPAKALTILLVDDEFEDLNLMQHALSGHGYRVITAMSVQDALHRFGQQSVDLLVTDISLPGRDGCALATELLSLSPVLKILFISGHVGAEVCRFYGISVSDLHFLRKPFSIAEFVSRVKAVLKSQEPSGMYKIRTQSASPKPDN